MKFIVHGKIREGVHKTRQGHFPLIMNDIQVPLEKETFSHIVEADTEELAIEELHRTVKGQYDFYIKNLDDGSTI